MNSFPKKSLSQNFLQDPNVICKIADAVYNKKPLAIAEIGPGWGALTDKLLAGCANVTVVEYDHGLAETWIDKAKQLEKLRCIEADITRLDWNVFLPVDVLCGNLPYHISADIIERTMMHHNKIQRAVFLVQTEFAEKCVMKPGNKHYGIISVLCGIYSEARILFKVSPHVFYPRPNVTSSLIELEMKKTVYDFSCVSEIVKTAFNQRRKKLKNSLKKYRRAEFENTNLWNRRADELNPEDFVQIINQIFDPGF